MNTSLQKIKNISRVGSFIAMLLLITLPCFYIAKWILIDHFGVANVQDILWGGLVMLIAWVMSEASKLEEEQQLTI